LTQQLGEQNSVVLFGKARATLGLLLAHKHRVRRLHLQ
jgi:hypothetical protein